MDRKIHRGSVLKTKEREPSPFHGPGKKRTTGAGTQPSASEGFAKKLRIWDLANATTMRGVRRGGI